MGKDQSLDPVMARGAEFVFRLAFAMACKSVWVWFSRPRTCLAPSGDSELTPSTSPLAPFKLPYDGGLPLLPRSNPGLFALFFRRLREWRTF
jgi:hypothetical protein